ncbi:REP element-mobilizing transposase RayT [Xanthomonas arboricola]|nr:REP element-mobilizing transposase RayT [Xanthomonas euroxanthea]
MPRQPRLELPSVPMHVVQRGVIRCDLPDDEDRHHSCLLLRMACERFAMHAFMLMDNHVHLLSRPIRLAQCLR